MGPDMGTWIGRPSVSELMCLARARLWEGLIPFTELFEEPDDDRSNDNQQGLVAQMVEQRPKKKSVKYEYDWRVVVANERRS